MKADKKYACHRVYDSCNHYQSQSVVAVSESGEVIGCTPLVQETSFTEWIGGVIILSPLTEVSFHTDDFGTMLHEMTSIRQTPLYAWHISNFDFTKEEPAPQSLIRRL